MPDKVPKQRLNIFLLKAGTSVAHAVAADDLGLISYPILDGLTFSGRIWIRTPQASPPRWMSFLKAGLSVELPLLLNQSVAALVVLSTAGRTFAVAFGSGRHWLADHHIERRFGMKVTLNTVDPDKVRSIDREEFDTITRKTRSQTSASANVESFGVDVQRDLLRSVTGQPEDTSFADHVTGSDNLILNVAVTFADLGAKCEEALTRYQSDNYKARYAWIDNFLRVNDPEEIEILDNELVRRLAAGELDNIFLSPPTLLDTQEHQGFRYPRERVGFHPDIRVEEFLSLPAIASALTIEALKRWRIREYTTSDAHAEREFTVYDAIVFDFSKNQKLYVLTQGEWFEINQNYVAQVEGELTSIGDHASLDLPDAQKGETEGDYNQRASVSSTGTLALLDKKLVQYGGGYSKIEVCDLLSMSKDFVHVKARTKSSALSHLFQQGLVSAQAFRDASFREAAKLICPSSHCAIFDGEPVLSHHTVTYAVMTSAPGDLRVALPFFSKQSLSNAAKTLRSMGYQVKLKKIPVQA